MRLVNYNPLVTDFLRDKDHPFSDSIEKLRMIILSSDDSLQENIKRNAPNYVFHGEDRITMRLFPSKSFQLIFHCGIKGNKSNIVNLLQNTTIVSLSNCL